MNHHQKEIISKKFIEWFENRSADEKVVVRLTIDYNGKLIVSDLLKKDAMPRRISDE